MHTLETLRARYATERSRFATLEGIPLHYTDEGARDPDAPVIVLVHGSFLDLASYDPWLPAFAGYRVVRYDRLRWGLTGQGAGPTITYADEEALLAALVAHLGLERFVLAGSSSGGMTAAAYAAHHPERVSRLVLINFPLGHGRINNAAKAKEPAPAPLPPVEAMRKLLVANFAEPGLVTEAMVSRYGEMMDREDPTGAIASSYAQAALWGEAERAKLLGELSMPTLVMWSRHNRTLAVEHGEAAFAAVGGQDKQFVVIEGAGHMLPLEKGELSGQVAGRFADGEELPAAISE
ncbi:alpha/beta fold hydrolase [Novosphingobium soli]|uniref:Alpha/beta fold hydrolase n=1 Tax=Novosphingobium soli TaxID=574956 RepID=A0ABV6CX14_9SPHN